MRRITLKMAVGPVLVMALLLVWGAGVRETYAAPGQSANSAALVAGGEQANSLQFNLAASSTRYTEALVESVSSPQDSVHPAFHVGWNGSFFIFLFALVAPPIALGLLIAACRIQDKIRNKNQHKI